MSKEIKEELKQEEQAHEAEVQTPAEENVSETTDEVAEAMPSLEDELARLKDTHLRLVAEYDNYRKRTLKEKSELIRNGGEKTLKDLLPVVDDIDIALSNIEATDDIEALREGVRLIYSKFVDYLSRQGVKAIETSEASFDEELHEAIATFPASDEAQKGKIIDCVKRGYTLHDKVLRHASVVVAQ